MKKLSNTSFIKLISRLLILLAIAKIITLSLWWFLPSDGREAQNTQSLKPAYQRVDFRNMLKGKSKNTAKTAATNKVKSSSTSITNMILKGLYGKGSSGMAIVALKSSSKKTSVISVGESFKGYVLKTILKESVIFTKNTKEYILRMSESKKTSKSIASIVAVEPTNTVVPRKEINEYINNKKNIWKDIAIDPYKINNKIKGFQVKRINKKSQLAILGLEKNDIIKIANNIELTSYKKVLDIYKNFKKLNTIQLIVLRNNEEVELVYEID